MASVMPALLPAWRPGSKSHEPKTMSWVETPLPLMVQLWRSQSFCHSPSVRSESQRPVVFKRRRIRPISCRKTHQSTCGHVSKHHTVQSFLLGGYKQYFSAFEGPRHLKFQVGITSHCARLWAEEHHSVGCISLEVPPLGGSRNTKARRTQIPGLQGFPL